MEHTFVQSQHVVNGLNKEVNFLLFLDAKGLQNVIGVSITHPVWQRTRPNDSQDQHVGWVFTSETKTQPFTPPCGHGKFIVDGNTTNSINEAHCIRDLYDIANIKTDKYSVPILWDKKENTMVNNESSDILRMLNNEFNEYANNPELDLYPQHLRNEIDAINDHVYRNINNGVYRCGFVSKIDVSQSSVYLNSIGKIANGI
jgi:glutathionyl-hydroquinone reductase